MNYSKSITKVFSVLFLFLLASCNIEPFEGDIPEESTGSLPVTCVDAAQNTATAATNFSTALSSDSNYTELCSAYKKALEDQVEICGDVDGAFQSLIDTLGECGKDEETSDDGDYWPMKIGNSWTYMGQTTGLPSTNSTMEITNFIKYKGVSSYLYENFFGSVTATDGSGLDNLQVDYYTRKSEGDYEVLVTELTADFSGLYRITQSEYNYIILKDNVDVGTKWDYNFDVTTSYETLIAGSATLPDAIANYDIKLEILEKDASIESGGVTYNSVIKVKFIQKVVVLGVTSTVEYVYAFAKDIGLVKTEGTVFDGDDNITSEVLQELTSYNIN